MALIRTVPAMLVWLVVPLVLVADLLGTAQLPLDYWLIWGFYAVVSLRTARALVSDVHPHPDKTTIAILSLGVPPIGWIWWAYQWMLRSKNSR